MPDITTLPLLAEIFGVTIDDLFDLTNEQRLSRIENRMDVEEELPQDLFMEFEEFLKAQLSAGENKKRATDLLAYLYWHRMNSFAQKVRRWAKESIRLAPGEKGNQWMLNMAEGHAVWDWNIANHTAAIEFYRELAASSPNELMPCVYLMDNLIADHRTKEAEELLTRLPGLGEKPVLVEVYRAHIALARFDEAEADRIMEALLKEHPEDDICLFEAAQYYAKKCDYDKALALYEKDFALDHHRPRFQDALMAISDIYELRGDCKKAAETYGRIVDLLETEWGFTEEVELQVAKEKRAALLAKATR